MYCIFILLFIDAYLFLDTYLYFTLYLLWGILYVDMLKNLKRWFLTCYFVA